MNKKINYVALGIILFFNFIFLVFNNLSNRIWGWDESVFVAMGKFIASGGEIGLWEHIRPIGIPIIHSLFGSWLKYNPIYLVLLFSIFSLLLVTMVYLISYELTKSNLISVINSTLLVFNPLFIEYSLRILSTIPATALILLAIYLFIKKKYMLSGFMCSVSFLFRFTHIIAGIGLGIILVYYSIKNKNIKNLLKFTIPPTITISIFFLFNYIFYSNYYFTHIGLRDYPFWKLAIAPLIEGGMHSFNLAYTGNFWYYIFYYLKYPIFILVIFSIPFLFRNRKTLAITLPSLFFMLFYQFITNKQYRFSLSFLPFLIIASTYLIRVFMNNNLKKTLLKKSVTVVLVILLSLTFFSYFTSYSSLYLWERSCYSEKMIEIFSAPDNYPGIYFTTHPSTAVYSNMLFISIYNHPDAFMKTFNNNYANYIFYHNKYFPFDEIYSEYSEEDINKELEIYELKKSYNHLDTLYQIRHIQ